MQRFQKGRSVFKCECCGRGTRETGVQSSGSDTCPQCYELCGLENSHSDGYPVSRQEVERLVGEVRTLGGNPAHWDELIAAAK